MKNISDMTRMTADELRNLIKVIIFALDNLYEDYRRPGISNKRLCQVYYKFLQMYMATCEELFTYDSCNQLQVQNKLLFFVNLRLLTIKFIDPYYGLGQGIY